MTTRIAPATDGSAARGRARHRLVPRLAVLGTVTLLSGCGMLGGSAEDPSPDGPAGTLLDQGTPEVELGVGETVQVSLGEGTPGVGDDWGVVSQTDEAVAGAEVVVDEQIFGIEEGVDATGAPIPYAVELTGLESGTTTVRVLYCTRTEIAEDCDQSHGTLEPPVEPVEITVTVP